MDEVPGKVKDILLYQIDDHRFGIDLHFVECVIEVVAVTPLVDSPEYILGAINMKGMALAVVDLRKKFGLGRSNMELSHQFIIARSDRHHLALLVDKTGDIAQLKVKDKSTDDDFLNKMQYLKGVALMQKDIVAIYDLDAFVLPQDQEKLNRALEKIAE